MINQMIKLNQRGQSIVQVLIAIGIMGILMMTMVSMFQAQNNEARSLKEKLAIADFQLQLTRSFADGTVCSSLLTGLSFDSTNAGAGSPNPPSIALPNSSVPISTLAGAPALATAGVALSPVSDTLFAAPTNTFQVRNIVGSSLSGAGYYSATFDVNFDAAKLNRPLRPASTQIVLLTSGGGSTQTITGCKRSTSGSQYSMPIATLSTYHDVCISITPPPYSGSQLMACMAACNRYCSNGCTTSVANCTGNIPGLGFSGGLMTEAGGGSAQCFCIP